MSLIDRKALYEKACGLEAQALAYVGKIVNDETKIEEWRIWSAILAERTAFKHDIFDAPEVKPEPKWIPVSDRLPEENVKVLCQTRSGLMLVASYGKLYLWSDEKGWISAELTRFHGDFLEAWMPLPERYREEGD